MATFEVFVPVQGEYIVTVEADSEADAIALISEGAVDWSEGEPNLEDDWEADIRAERIADDAGMRYAQTPHAIYAGVDRSGYTTVEESTGRVYSMRHFNIASLV